MIKAGTPNNRNEVFVIAHQAVERFFRQPSFICDEISIRQIWDLVLNAGKFVDREWAEMNSCVKQIVSYGIVRHNNEVLCLRRSQKSARDSLRLRYTLLVGGHVDAFEKSSSNPLETCLLRELEEELGLIPNCVPSLLGIAVDPTTKVGQLHLGFVFDVPIESASLMVSSHLDNEEFVNSSESNCYQLTPLDKLLDLSFDSWSKLFLASEACAKVFGASNADRLQKKLPLLWCTQ